MKLKKRKIKYAAIFCLCWFAFLVILVDKPGWQAAFAFHRKTA